MKRFFGKIGLGLATLTLLAGGWGISHPVMAQNPMPTMPHSKMTGGKMTGGMMKGGMMKGGMMPQTAASKRVSALVAKIKAGPNYNCCIRPMCDDCAVTMGSCPCGKHAAMGMPVCTQCKGSWDAGMGVIPGKTAADIKVMKPMGGMMMKGKKMGMAAPASATTIVVSTCPITGGKVIGAGVGLSRVANYEVHFCCAGCKPEFDKLSKAAQLQKIRAVLAKS